MLIGKPNDIPSSEITPYDIYLNRRKFIRESARFAGLAGVAALVPSALAACDDASAAGAHAQGASQAALQEELTPWEDVTGYNNFYEFGTGKDDPKKNSGEFEPRPWKVTVEGMVENPAEYDLDDLLRGFTMEDRIYRLRCVEAWSMVIPWRGFPLAALIDRLGPLPSAKYVEFTTVHRPEQMPGQRRPILPWPYVEGLRLDEATHPLTLMATGVYGRDLPNQNGAPLRLVVPWKYGFKSIKSIVKLRFTEHQPMNTWQRQAPREYGFYANVNPEVDHPRWSQARERRLGELRRRRTLMFNGYADEVAHLYEGMDLRRNF